MLALATALQLILFLWFPFSDAKEIWFIFTFARFEIRDDSCWVMEHRSFEIRDAEYRGERKFPGPQSGRPYCSRDLQRSRLRYRHYAGVCREPFTTVQRLPAGQDPWGSGILLQRFGAFSVLGSAAYHFGRAGSLQSSRFPTIH
jgi:hypothetical protein